MEFNSGIVFDTNEGWRMEQVDDQWRVYGYGEEYWFSTESEAKQKLIELTA